MMNKRKLKIHAAFAALALMGAVLLVSGYNASYWHTEPFSGGETTREVAEDRPWMEPGIARLVRVWSFPLGAVMFFSLYGACASVFELNNPLRYIMAGVFLYPIIGFVLLLLFFPIAVGVLSGVLSALVLLVCSAIMGNRRWAGFSSAALLHNILVVLIAFFHFRAWYEVFGD